MIESIITVIVLSIVFAIFRGKNRKKANQSKSDLREDVTIAPTQMQSFPSTKFEIDKRIDIFQILEYIDHNKSYFDFNIETLHIVNEHILITANMREGRFDIHFASMLYISDNFLIIHSKNLVMKTITMFANKTNRQVEKAIRPFLYDYDNYLREKENANIIETPEIFEYEKNICPACGYAINENTSICNECGLHLN